MKNAYNTEALNRVAAQDRLDRMIVLVSPGVWLSLLGAFLIFLVVTVWAFKGSLPTSVDTKGMYTNSSGVDHLYAQSEGFVTEVCIVEGDEVEEGQLIATLGTEDDIFKIKQMDSRIQYVENMTFDSELDEVTSDTEKMAQIKLDAKTASNTAKKTGANLELKKEQLEEAEALVKEKEDLMLQYKEKYYSTLNITDQKEQLAYTEANDDYDKHFSLYESYKTTYISAQEAYYTKKNDFDAKYALYDDSEATDAQRTEYNAALADLESAESQAADAKYFMETEEEKLNTANTTLEEARKAYLEALNSTSGTAADNTIASTEYSEALQAYSTAKANYTTLKNEIDNLEMQEVLDEGDAEVSIESYEQQFDNEKSIVLHDLEAQRDSLLNSADKKEIRATGKGKVYDLFVSVGTAVAQGSEVAQLLNSEEASETVICYVKISDAKKIEEGMEAHVFPSTIDKEEYGHIIGKVTSVKNHVASNFDMKTQLGEESLIEEFSKEGAVQEVQVTLELDPTTESGYKWSSNKGADVKLSAGTLVSVTVVTENKEPVDVVIPYIKHKLQFTGDEDDE